MDSIQRTPRVRPALMAAALALTVSSTVADPRHGSHGGDDTFAAQPEPARPGPYQVCPRPYPSPRPRDNDLIAGIIYVPVAEATRSSCTMGPKREYNLAIIAHADGDGTDYTSYDGLGRHLASHGLIAVSIRRYTGNSNGAWEVFDQVLTDHLLYLYQDSEVVAYLGSRVGLIGHSAGGKSVIYRGGEAVQALGKVLGTELGAIVALSPAVNDPPVLLSDVTDAFLGIHVVDDRDDGTFGSKAAGAVMTSVFKVYDEAGVGTSPHAFGMEKDLLFVEPPLPAYESEGHYYQGQPFVLAYVNAYLQLHLNGHTAFRRFFRHQESPFPPGAEERPWWTLQQHEDRERLTLDDFDDGICGENTLGGDNNDGTAPIDCAADAPTYSIDEFSPHNTGVHRVDVDPSDPDGPPTRCFLPPKPLDVSAYAYLGLRATQVYHPQWNPGGTAQDVLIRLETTAGHDSISLATADRPLYFPEVRGLPPGLTLNVAAAPEVTAGNAATKNAMRSHLVRLSEFQGVDLSAVTAVCLDFSTVTQPTRIIFDDVAFHGH